MSASLPQLLRAAMFALLVTTLSLVISSPAHARNNPVAFLPAIEEKPGQAPDAVTIAFVDPVQPKAYIVVEQPGGGNVAVGDPRLESTNLSVRLKDGLPRGTYTVKYRIEGDNGPEGGAYQFAVGSGDFSMDGLTQWGGFKDMPSDLRLPGDDAAERKAERKAEREAERRVEQDGATPAAPTAEQTPSAGTPSDGTSSDGVVNSAEAEDNDGTSILPWVLGGLALVAAAAAAGVVFMRRRASADA